MLDFLIEIDTKLFLALNDLHLPFFDYFMKAFTGKIIWAPMYSVILFILYRRFGWKVATTYVIGIVLAIALADQICASYIRPFVERLRPSNLANPIHSEVHIVDGYRGGQYGFPSCHAANSFALATFCSFFICVSAFYLFYIRVGYFKLLFKTLFGSSLSRRLDYRSSCRVVNCCDSILWLKICRSKDFTPSKLLFQIGKWQS